MVLKVMMAELGLWRMGSRQLVQGESINKMAGPGERRAAGTLLAHLYSHLPTPP
jgi:hypothetical protein